jgi:diaminohydroxyphosphoribosylaminopyrimidine deaminase / 5-amino-6-(5-phosphoribosylamino)uracil reductase
MHDTPTSPFSAHDQVAMAQALTWAELGIGLTDPNPRVGCVISDGHGRVLGAGHTQQAGGPHAEVMAIRAALADGHALRGATVHVTLEPCAHHGRTPPCVDALIAAGVGRVVAAVLDPNPLVAGQGLARLQAAGISVAHGLMADAARELNIGFFSRMLRGRPWVRLKVAASLDGRTALPDGTSQWITGPQARADGHAWRRRAGAVLTGIGTVREDDPRLDVRLVPTARQPLRVVLDARLDTPPHARLLEAPGEVLLVCAAEALNHLRASALTRSNVTLQPVATDKNGWIDLHAVLDALGQRGVNELHIEAGQHLNGSFVRAGLVDEYLVYLAPRLLGAGRDMAAFGPLAQIADAAPLVFTDLTRIGADVRLMARSATAFGSPA